MEMATGVYPYGPDMDPKNLPMQPKKEPGSASGPTKLSDLAVFDVISSVQKGPVPRYNTPALCECVSERAYVSV